MKEKETTVLVTAKDTRTLRRLTFTVYQTLNAVRVSDFLRIDKAINSVLRGRIDICIVSDEMIENHADGAQLVKEIRGFSPHIPIVFYTGNKDSKVASKLMKKYENIKCVVEDLRFIAVRDALVKAEHVTKENEKKYFKFSKIDTAFFVAFADIVTVSVGGSNRLDFQLYDAEAQKFSYESIEMSLTQFMREHNNNAHFFRVSQDKALNNAFIKHIDVENRYIELTVNNKVGDPIVIDIGERYVKDIIAHMKGGS